MNAATFPAFICSVICSASHIHTHVPPLDPAPTFLSPKGGERWCEVIGYSSFSNLLVCVHCKWH